MKKISKKLKLNKKSVIRLSDIETGQVMGGCTCGCCETTPAGGCPEPSLPGVNCSTNIGKTTNDPRRGIYC